MASKFFQFVWSLVLGTSSLGLSPSVFAKEAPSSNIAMWKIQSAQNTVYLLGSVHVGKSCMLTSPRIRAAMAEAEHAVFEIDFTQVTPQDRMQLSLAIAKAGELRPGDRTLKQSVSAPTYERLRQKYDELKPPHLKLNLDTLNEIYHPGFIALQIRGLQTQKLGLSGECGVDQLLTKQAQAAQKNIVALETFEQQSALLQTVLETIAPQQNNEKAFQRLLSPSPKIEVNTLLSSTMAGDLETIEKTVIDSCKSTPEICETVLEDRNIAWLPQIKTFLQDQDDYLIIVGVAHMVGPNNLINLLENANYQVEPF